MVPGCLCSMSWTARAGLLRSSWHPGLSSLSPRKCCEARNQDGAPCLAPTHDERALIWGVESEGCWCTMHASSEDHEGREWAGGHGTVVTDPRAPRTDCRTLHPLPLSECGVGHGPPVLAPEHGPLQPRLFSAELQTAPTEGMRRVRGVRLEESVHVPLGTNENLVPTQGDLGERDTQSSSPGSTNRLQNPDVSKTLGAYGVERG